MTSRGPPILSMKCRGPSTSLGRPGEPHSAPDDMLFSGPLPPPFSVARVESAIAEKSSRQGRRRGFRGADTATCTLALATEGIRLLYVKASPLRG